MFEVVMPKAGQTVEEGVIVSWAKAEGQTVTKGEVLADIETDKAVFELESPASGVLLKILHPEGTAVPVYGLIALVGEPQEDADGYLASRVPGEPPTESKTAAASARAPGVAAPERPAGPIEVKSSPAARKAARDLGVDLAKIGRGSGPDGLITTADVEQFAEAKGSSQIAGADAGAGGEPVRRELSRMRKAVAASLAFSKQTIPHFYMKLTVNAGRLEKLWQAARQASQCSLNDLVVLACARAMREFPEFRSRMEGDGVLEFPSANVGIAVAANDGLVVPVVVRADEMSLETLALETRRIVEAARAGKVEGLGRGTFTVTNLGMFGIEEFAAIINPPEPAILAVGAIRDAAVVAEGHVHAGRVMTLVLSADHRIVDGVAAAKFMSKVKDLLENPEPLSGPKAGGTSS